MTLNFDYQKLLNRLGFYGERPPLEAFYKYIFVAFVAYLSADLATLYLRQYLIPTQPPAKVRMLRRAEVLKKPSYGQIETANIFNADHKIAPAIGGDRKNETFEEDNDPVPTSLPLTLVGTIVHGNPKKSVTTIQESGKRDIESFKVDEEIPGMAKIKEITRDKVIFRNLKNRKLEYVEIKEDRGINLGISGKKTAPVETAKVAKTNFNLKRGEVQKHLNNLSSVLNDATAVPNKRPDGSLHGFRLVHIKPGSIYERLGLKRGDVLMGVGGEEIDSPQRAMELYQQLKDSDNIQLDIERGGKKTTMNYDIAE